MSTESIDYRWAAATEPALPGVVRQPGSAIVWLRGDDQPSGLRPPGTDRRITPLLIRTLELVAAGLTNVAIAQELGTSPHTVKSNVGRLCRALRAHDRANAVLIGMRLGLIP